MEEILFRGIDVDGPRKKSRTGRERQRRVKYASGDLVVTGEKHMERALVKHLLGTGRFIVAVEMKEGRGYMEDLREHIEGVAREMGAEKRVLVVNPSLLRRPEEAYDVVVCSTKTYLQLREMKERWVDKEKKDALVFKDVRSVDRKRELVESAVADGREVFFVCSDGRKVEGREEIGKIVETIPSIKRIVIPREGKAFPAKEYVYRKYVDFEHTFVFCGEPHQKEATLTMVFQSESGMFPCIVVVRGEEERSYAKKSISGVAALEGKVAHKIEEYLEDSRKWILIASYDMLAKSALNGVSPGSASMLGRLREKSKKLVVCTIVEKRSRVLDMYRISRGVISMYTTREIGRVKRVVSILEDMGVEVEEAVVRLAKRIGS
jgi:hypothetical protein